MKRNTNTILAALAALALFLLAGCGGSQQQGIQERESAEPPSSGEFVGEASGANDAFLALVADKPEQGEQTREVRAYLCDGQGISEWFVGQASANDFELSSDSGARLAANLSNGEANGTLTLSDGKSANFEARPATGIEGFYPVTVTPEGLVSGTSWRGTQLEGQRAGQRITGTITPPDAEPVPFGVSGPSIDEGEYRWIFFDGQLKGAKKGASSGFMDKGIDL